MKSRTSFFDIRFSRHLLRRFWPLWLLWLIVLFLAGPLSLNGNYSDLEPLRFLSELRRDLLTDGYAIVWLSLAMGALMAMGMLSYLYFPRPCGLVNSLPLKRETVYFTAVLTGLVPMLLSDLLVFAVLLLLYGKTGVGTRYFLWWLEMALLANAGFYGFACFCGTLTGNVLVLPAVYVVLNCAVGLFEASIRQVFSTLLYGYAYSTLSLEWLSPPLWMTDHADAKVLTDMNLERGIAADLEPTTLPYLAGLCAAGVVFMLLGALILRRRQMETVGEVVAVPVLQPIFRLCMALGCGLFGSAVMVDEFLQLHGAAKFPALALLLCVFAALGWFIAEMLIRKSLRVFDHGWKQLGLIWAVLLVFVTLTELDVFGYETYVPAASGIESIDMPYMMSGGLHDSKSVEAVLDFQRGIISHKEQNEARASGSVYYLHLYYHLKGGGLYERLYRLPQDAASLKDPDSDISAWERLNNTNAFRLRRVWADNPLAVSDIRDAWVEIQTPLGEHRYKSDHVLLTPEQAVSLHREGIVPDAQAGKISDYVVRATDESLAENTNLSVCIMRRVPTGDVGNSAVLSLDVAVLRTSENTLHWLKENLDLAPTEE